MGRIRISDLGCYRLQQNSRHDVEKEKAEVEHVEIADIEQPQTPETKTACLRENEKSSDASYPILPRKIATNNLPFITPNEVAERDGQGSNRLCTYQLPTS